MELGDCVIGYKNEELSSISMRGKIVGITYKDIRNSDSTVLYQVLSHCQLYYCFYLEKDLKLVEERQIIY